MRAKREEISDRVLGVTATKLVSFERAVSSRSASMSLALEAVPAMSGRAATSGVIPRSRCVSPRWSYCMERSGLVCAVAGVAVEY